MKPVKITGRLRVLRWAGLLLLANCGREVAHDPQPIAAGTAEAAAPAAEVETVDAARFKSAAEAGGGIYLDVRTPGEVARGRIPNASVIDINDPKFIQKVSLMQKDKPVFVYCASGGRSAAAAEKMSTLGFKKLYNLQGGLRTWIAAGFEVESSPTTEVRGQGMDPAAFGALVKGEKRVLVEFHTPWCTPCRKMAPIVGALSDAWKGRARIVQLDVESSEAVAQREHIQGVPVFVLYVDGKEKWRHSGELTREALEAELGKP